MSAPTPEELVAQAVPLSEPGLKGVGGREIDGIPLPPDHLVDELDNAGPAAAEPEQPAEVATLDFLGDDLPEWTRTLKHPFRWEGEPVREITLRQLTALEVGQIYARASAEKRTPDIYEVYSLMTHPRLPAKVLRALPAVDGEPVIDKAWDFLPPSLRPAGASAPTPKTP